MKRLTAFFILLFYTCTAFPQQREVKGVLLDATDLSSLPHGIIKVKADTSLSAITDDNGHFQLKISKPDSILIFQCAGYRTEEKIIPAALSFIRVLMHPDTAHTAMAVEADQAAYRHDGRLKDAVITTPVNVYHAETYDRVRENRFLSPREDPVSMFAVSTDEASYSNLRRFINGKEKAPPEAIRIEEMVNYFPYHYPQPREGAVLDMHTGLTDCPWKQGDRLLRISLRAKKIPPDSLPPANLVFLLDVSGSMSDPNKLPLLKAALKILIPQLNARDLVSIVLYNDSARLALPPTPGSRQQIILDMVDNLVADGTTAGEQGIRLAYKVATENFIPGGVNRVILATDGDFNVGPSADDDMRKLILLKRQSGVYLTCLGLGEGNYKDSKLETLARWGNGNFFYLDNAEEANKLFGEELEGTLFTIARDAVMKVVFDSTVVKAYRLIGYENRLFTASDSEAVPMEGGLIGAGLGVTAFYEITPLDAATENFAVPPARLTLQFIDAEDGRRKEISANATNRMIPFSELGSDDRFAAAVALFGMLLKGSAFKGNGSYDLVLSLARKAIDRKEKEPYRKEFLKLVKAVRKMKE